MAARAEFHNHKGASRLGVSPVVISRRQLLIASLVGGATTLLRSAACVRAVEGPCRLTPRQTEGPFYPIDDQLDEDNDLTFVSGRSGTAEGPVIYVIGQVQDSQCRPVEGARVEIWQASARGRYNHPYDMSNPVPLDPYFQGWGETVTDQEGQYRFKTVHPGRYPAGPGWIRPSHIHFKLSGQGFPELTTQMYFAGDPYLDQDRIFLDVPPAERDSVRVNREKPGSEFGIHAVVYRFNLSLPRRS